MVIGGFGETAFPGGLWWDKKEPAVRDCGQPVQFRFSAKRLLDGV